MVMPPHQVVLLAPDKVARVGLELLQEPVAEAAARLR